MAAAMRAYEVTQSTKFYISFTIVTDLFYGRTD